MACFECRRRRIKCDNNLPSCRTCTRLQKRCGYPTADRRGRKPRHQIDGLDNGNSPSEQEVPPQQHDNQQDLSGLPGADLTSGDAEMIFDDNFDIDFTDITGPWLPPPTVSDVTFPVSSPINSVEELPSPEMIEELNRVFSEIMFPRYAIVHPYRYQAGLLLSAPEQPPLCLRYIMWALAALYTKDYAHLANTYYEKSRHCLQDDEMNGNGTDYPSIAHVQAWAFISCYESYPANFKRAYMSNRRAIALTAMLELHALDAPKRRNSLLPQISTFAEEEERRRTFWSVYQGDRWVSVGTGRPMSMNEADITTYLPVSDEAFFSSTPEQGRTLQQVLTNGMDDSSSITTGNCLIACLLGKIMSHSYEAQNESDDNDRESFMTRHQQLDNTISFLAFSIPEHLRPSRSKSSEVYLLNMGFHGLTISLHRTAIKRAELCRDQETIAKSRHRCKCAAEEIVELMQLMAPIGAFRADPYTPSRLYLAIHGFLTNCIDGKLDPRSHQQICFLYQCIKQFGRYWQSAQLVLCQLDKDLEANGVDVGEKYLNQNQIPGIDQDLGFIRATKFLAGLFPEK